METYEQKLYQMLDIKHQTAETIISGGTINQFKNRRLITKLKHAKIILNSKNINGELEIKRIAEMYRTTPEKLIRRSSLILEPNANLHNLTVEEYSILLIKGELQWTKNLDAFYLLIETFEEYFLSILSLNETGFRNKILDEILKAGDNLGIGCPSSKSDDILSMAYLQMSTIISRNDKQRILEVVVTEMA